MPSRQRVALINYNAMANRTQVDSDNQIPVVCFTLKSNVEYSRNPISANLINQLDKPNALIDYTFK